MAGNLLYISSDPVFPPNFGGASAAYGLIAELSKMFDITLFTRRHWDGACDTDEGFQVIFGFPTSENIRRRQFSTLFAFIRLPKIVALIRARNVAVVIIDQCVLGWMGIALRKITGVTFITRSQNIDSLRYKAMRSWRAAFFSIYEKWVYRNSDFVFFISENDLETAKSVLGLDPAKCILCTYGVHRGAPQEPGVNEVLQVNLGITADEKIILFFGKLDYKPNVEALHHILLDIEPILRKRAPWRYKIVICGMALPMALKESIEARKETIVYAGNVEDIKTYIVASHLVITPLATGGGIRTKILESLALHKTVVSTVTGASGIDSKICGEKLIIVPDGDWRGFADAVISHIDDKGATQEAFFKKYQWETVVVDAQTVIERAMSRNG